MILKEEIGGLTRVCECKEGDVLVTASGHKLKIIRMREPDGSLSTNCLAEEEGEGRVQISINSELHHYVGSDPGFSTLSDKKMAKLKQLKEKKKAEKSKDKAELAEVNKDVVSLAGTVRRLVLARKEALFGQEPTAYSAAIAEVLSEAKRLAPGLAPKKYHKTLKRILRRMKTPKEGDSNERSS